MYEGGCLCGALRFRADDRPIDSGYCHCSLCRRSTGAPVLAWVSFPATAFSYTKGRAAIFESSSWGHREFCNLCGAQIGYRKTDAATTVDLNVGCMDGPVRISPAVPRLLEGSNRVVRYLRRPAALRGIRARCALV